MRRVACLPEQASNRSNVDLVVEPRDASPGERALRRGRGQPCHLERDRRPSIRLSERDQIRAARPRSRPQASSRILPIIPPQLARRQRRRQSRLGDTRRKRAAVSMTPRLPSSPMIIQAGLPAEISGRWAPSPPPARARDGGAGFCAMVRNTADRGRPIAPDPKARAIRTFRKQGNLVQLLEAEIRKLQGSTPVRISQRPRRSSSPASPHFSKG
jgi:hypothetical protein